MIEIQRNDDVIHVKGPCFGKTVEWTYSPSQILMRISTLNQLRVHQTVVIDVKHVDPWNLYLEDERVARYFWSLWHHELPPFDEHVFQTCPFILSLYTGWKKEPYDFRGIHKIHDHEWCQYDNEGNEITIDGRHFRFSPRRVLYAGIQWWQKHVYSAAMLYIKSELLPLVIGDLVCGYYEDVNSDYVEVDNVHLKPNASLCYRDF